jgi:uncharacterized protein YegP (UPF0339 family)
MRTAIVAVLLFAFISFTGFTPGQDKKDGPYVFEVYKDRSEEYRFRFKDGDTILAIAGKGYKTKADVEKVIDAIKKHAAKAKEVEAK